MEPIIGQILLFAFPRVPTGWAACNGQLLSIAQYDALFSLIGTTYGGDGQSTFALPDLRGRVPVHQGQGNGLSTYVMGQQTGSEQVTLTLASMPSHSHSLQAATAAPAQGATGTPGPQVEFAVASGASPYTAAPSGSPAMLAGQSVGPAGGNMPHDNMMPTLVMNYCIALYGIFPTPS
ncbi:MAG: phage tail protein [Paracoccaceae bacterium]|nr:phage tail protein [Paracoccaceae bacterium]MDE3240580.1 phage tail protein [Paracoccaceae bacterium]